MTIPDFPELTMSPFQQGDQPQLILHLTDADVGRNTLTIPQPYTREDADSWLALTEQHLAERGVETHWAIRHQDSGLIGGIGNMFKYGPDAHLDEIGYWLAAPFRGRGYMTAVVKRYTQYLHESFGMIRVEANVFTYNPASARLLEKAGYQREGLRRKAFKKGDGFVDAIHYAWVQD